MAMLQSASGIRSMLGLQAARALSHSLASTSVCSSFHSKDAAPSRMPAEPLYEGARPTEETMGTGLLWGRGDKRTWRGKIFRGSFGKSRPKKLKDPHAPKAWWHQPAVDPDSPIHIPSAPQAIEMQRREQLRRQQLEELERYHREKPQVQAGAVVFAMAAVTLLQCTA